MTPEISSARTKRTPPNRAALVLFALGVLVAPPALSAQKAANARVSTPDTIVYKVDPLVVTATRGAREVSRTPQPVSVVQHRDLVQQVPNTISDLFRSLPGVDVTGVGVNQGRPEIRGQRGQRILLLEDGLRLNNSRRQQDFGELPALVDVNAVQRVEVVRGPASVLYGSDAIGGVVNIITSTPDEEGFHGFGSLRYGNVESQKTGSARIYGRSGAFTVQAGGKIRNADAYEAPSGRFGAIDLNKDVLVSGTGVKDRSADLRLGWEPAGHHSIYGKFETYTAEDAGFGSVDPAAYAPDQPDIRITYPKQRWNKLTAGYLGRDLGTPVADQVSIQTYGQDNERNLDFAMDMGIGPGASLSILQQNYTNIRTYGGRAEARKLALPGLVLTYGLDFVRERAEGLDHSATTVLGYGPPMIDMSDRPQLPTATFTTLGAFAQGEVQATRRLSFVAGGRYQTAKAQTYATAGLSDQTPVAKTDATFVAALNGLFEVGAGFSLVGSAGRAFRSPNLIERFFDGATPEGSGYQVANPDLKAETSFNVDLGARYRKDRVSFEAFGFRNKVYDGIRIEPLDYKVQGQSAYQNTNVEQLLFRGVELNGQVSVTRALSVGSNYTWMTSKDALHIENPVGESFSSKVTGTVRYEDPSDRFWAAWEIRHNGDRKDVQLHDNPIGDILPAFTVQDLRAGVTVFRTAGGQVHRLSVALTNLTNQLYAEFSNASFFRPEPKRNLTLSWDVSF